MQSSEAKAPRAAVQERARRPSDAGLQELPSADGGESRTLMATAVDVREGLFSVMHAISKSFAPSPNSTAVIVIVRCLQVRRRVASQGLPLRVCLCRRSNLQPFRARRLRPRLLPLTTGTLCSALSRYLIVVALCTADRPCPSSPSQPQSRRRVVCAVAGCRCCPSR